MKCVYRGVTNDLEANAKEVKQYQKDQLYIYLKWSAFKLLIKKYNKARLSSLKSEDSNTSARQAQLRLSLY